MTDGCGPFRGPRRPLSICKNFLSCQLPDRTNVNQRVSFSTEITFFSFCKKSFSDGLSLALLASLGRCKNTVPSHIAEGGNYSVTLPHPLLGSGLCCMQKVSTKSLHAVSLLEQRDWQPPGAPSPELRGCFELR